MSEATGGHEPSPGSAAGVAGTGGEPAVVVSCDGHVGPRLREQLRPYCPSRLRDAFDEFAAAHERQQAALLEADGDEADLARAFRAHPNMAAAGHHDAGARLRDMDLDGVAAELIWHFSQNGEPLPWSGHGLGTVTPGQFEMAAVGYRLYNRWLADFCSADRRRLLGLVYLPLWDLETSLAELRRAERAGLRVVNFPPPGRPGIPEYNSPEWEPFWSACEELGISLATHSSGGPLFNYDAGPGSRRLAAYEGGGWLARRAVWWLVYGEVFERHPRLRLVITEQYEGWWRPTLWEMDSVYMTFGGSRPLPRLPSEYVRTNVFLGASFMSRSLAEEASEHGYAGNVLWGRDYPHVEGTWRAPSPGREPLTKLALRHVLCRVPAAEALAMAGGNAVRVYGLDGDYLARTAAGIGALTAAELSVEPVDRPDVDRSNAFIGQAGARPPEPERAARSPAAAHW